MPIQIGRYNKRIIVEYPVEVQVPSGEVQTSFRELTPLWASIEPLVGKEFFDNTQVRAEVDTRIRTRFNRRINEKMRVKYITERSSSPTEFDIYNIQAVIHVREGRRETQLMCSKVTAQGFRGYGVDE